jgi:hypothetical protein
MTKMSEQNLGPGGIDTRTPDMAQGRAEVAREHDMTAETCLGPLVGGRAGRLPANDAFPAGQVSSLPYPSGGSGRE